MEPHQNEQRKGVDVICLSPQRLAGSHSQGIAAVYRVLVVKTSYQVAPLCHALTDLTEIYRLALYLHSSCTLKTVEFMWNIT